MEKNIQLTSKDIFKQVFELRLVAEKYKEVANRELKTAVEQVQCANIKSWSLFCFNVLYNRYPDRILFMTLHTVSLMIFFRILEPFRRHANVSVIVHVYVAQDTGGDYSKVLQKLLNPDLKIA